MASLPDEDGGTQAESAMVPLAKADQALASAKSLSEIKAIIDVATAAQEWARRRAKKNSDWATGAKSGEDLFRYAARVKLKAQRRAGQWLSGLDKKPGARTDLTSSQPAKRSSEYQEAIQEADIGKDSASRWQRVWNVPEKDFEEYLRTGEEPTVELTTAGLLRETKIAARREDLVAQQAAINSGAVILPAGVFEVISIDPPWPYGTEYDPETRRAANPYPEMSLHDLTSLELPAAEDCILWLWTTHKFMRHSFELLDAWGFRDVAILTWVKDRIGLGSWLRSQTEFCIMAVKGQPQVILTNQPTVVYGPLRQHSRKPASFYEMVDGLCIGRKLEYFSCEKRAGWEQVGNATDLHNAVV